MSWMVNTGADLDDADVVAGRPLDTDPDTGIARAYKVISLRSAIQTANAHPEIGPFTINFAGNVNQVGLTRVMDPISTDIAVDGGNHVTIIGGADSKGMFKIMPDATVSFSNLTMTGGSNRVAGGAGSAGRSRMLGS